MGKQTRHGQNRVQSQTRQAMLVVPPGGVCLSGLRLHSVLAVADVASYCEFGGVICFAVDGAIDVCI